VSTSSSNSPDQQSSDRLPERPSLEHLRKAAKRLATRRKVRLAEAQRELAKSYGFADWAALRSHVLGLTTPRPLSPLAQAAREGDVASVRRLLAEGHDPNDPEDSAVETSPLWEACNSNAPGADRLAIAEALLAGGANSRKGVPGQRPLHAVALRGPVALAELLIAHGAIEWEPNAKGRSALAIARRSRAEDRKALVELLDRPVIRDPSFSAAVDAIHAGDAAELARRIDAEPRLLTERIREPECYLQSGRSQYFLDPKLFWFIANNPTLVEKMPANTPEIARSMIARGISREDLDVALGLVMTSTNLRESGLQNALMLILLEAGAQPRAEDMGGVLAHGETEAVEHLLAAGMPLTAPIAAALDRLEALPGLLAGASQKEIDEALDLAVINNRLEATRLALRAGANPDRFSSQHTHSQPLHQAALHDNIALLELLIAHGARLDVVDHLWGGTPLGWAKYGRTPPHPATVEFLEKATKGAG
jgi:ankyrin repeat protein